MLIDYKGTVILVSHDRAFLNNVVTSTLVFEGDGVINQYVGGYDDWLRQRDPLPQSTATVTANVRTKTAPPATKLSYKDQRELTELPQKIESLETNIKDISLKMSAPEFYQSERTLIEKTEQQLTAYQTELNDCYQRWELLEQ